MTDDELAYVEAERDHFAQVARDTFQELKAMTAERDRYVAQLREAWGNPLATDDRPVDLGAIVDLLEQEIDDVGEVGIWGDYGPPAAPVSHIVRLLLDNADAIQTQAGDYSEGI